MRRARLTVAFAIVAGAGCAGEDPAPRAVEAPGAVRTGTVERVVDGDTLIVRLADAQERVRMLGVDAPESVTPDRPVECFGPEAAARARLLLPEGSRVTLTGDPTQGERDRFGRLLAEVALPGELVTVNELLVAGGVAEVFRGDGRGRLQPRLRAAEREARAVGRGLWGACPGGR